MQKDYPYALIQFYATAPYACSYLPDRNARSQVATPGHLIDPQLYSELVRRGFRRSGVFTYRPYCDHCRACVPVRIPVERFEPDRSQRRCLARNADIQTRIAPARRTAEHFELYQRYLAARHRDGGMDGHGTVEFDQFLVGSWSDTRFVEMRLAGDHGPGRLLAVAVTDRVGRGLSAVYTFFEPELAQRGLGTLAILRQIEWARREGLDHLYLGYWIDGHGKMDYKRRFQPLEAFDGRQWRRFRL